MKKYPKRLTVSIEIDLLEKIDIEAKHRGLTRSQYVRELILQDKNLSEENQLKKRQDDLFSSAHIQHKRRLGGSPTQTKIEWGDDENEEKESRK